MSRHSGSGPSKTKTGRSDTSASSSPERTRSPRRTYMPVTTSAPPPGLPGLAATDAGATGYCLRSAKTPRITTAWDSTRRTTGALIAVGAGRPVAAATCAGDFTSSPAANPPADSRTAAPTTAAAARLRRASTDLTGTAAIPPGPPSPARPGSPGSWLTARVPPGLRRLAAGGSSGRQQRHLAAQRAAERRHARAQAHEVLPHRRGLDLAQHRRPHGHQAGPRLAPHVRHRRLDLRLGRSFQFLPLPETGVRRATGKPELRAYRRLVMVAVGGHAGRPPGEHCPHLGRGRRRSIVIELEHLRVV